MFLGGGGGDKLWEIPTKGRELWFLIMHPIVLFQN